MKEDKKFEFADYDILCLIKFVLKHFWMVVLFALTCIMGVYLLQSVSDKPIYTSTVTFAVTSRSSASTAVVNIAATDTVAGQFGGLLESEVVRNAAARSMGLSHFPASVSIHVPENTNILVMSITADTPELAYKSALAIIDCHTEYSATVFSQAVIDSINGPTIPTEPANQASRNTMLKISGPVGAIAMIALLVFLAIRNDTVQTITGAKHQVDGKLLATIYHETRRLSFKEKLKRVKKSILISDPTCSFYYTETIHQIRVQMERAKETKQHKIFLVASCSENEGKSTVAANLALSLAQKHRKVLLLDADTRKPAQHLIFEEKVEKGKDFGSILTHSFSKEKLMDSISYNESTKLYTLYTSAIHRKKAEAISKDTLAPILRALREEFSYVIIDTPPIGFFADAEVLADVADASILVIRQDMAPSMIINDAIDNLMETNSEFMGFVFNNVRSFKAFSFKTGGYEYGYGYGYGYGKSGGKQATSEKSQRSGKEGKKHG